MSQVQPDRIFTAHFDPYKNILDAFCCGFEDVDSSEIIYSELKLRLYAPN